MRVAPGELDLERFERAAAAGRESLAAGLPERAAAQLREALGEWRGPALADLAAMPFAAGEIERLEEERLVALEARVDADLALGRHAELVGELRGVVAANPWRERLHGQLMLALYRTGRQADALDAYAAARAALVEELGIEPGPELRDLQVAVLAHDPRLAPPGVARAPALPAPPTTLFGRADDLDRLCEQLRARAWSPSWGRAASARPRSRWRRRTGSSRSSPTRLVRLAPVADPGELEGAIERALALPDGRPSPLPRRPRAAAGARQLRAARDAVPRWSASCSPAPRG